MHLSPGTILDGKFEIISLLGEGGMGAVYRASQIGLDRIVALKFLRLDDETADREAVARLEREAQALSELKHKNIVTVYGLQAFSGHPFIVMEYVAGKSLQSMLYEGKPLEITFVTALITSIGDALQCAHRTGIVHRDLKPSNVIIADSGEIKLLDFGLAKLLPTYGKPVQQLTDVGMAVGSVLYMSPEQCVGEPCDERSDIYAFACLIFHCMTGRPPFTADHAVVVMNSHVNGVVPTLRELGLEQHYPSAVQMVLDKAMEKNAADRYDNIQDFRDDLLRALSGGVATTYDRRPSAALPLAPGAPRGARTVSALVISGLLIIAFGGIGFLLYQSYSREKQRDEITSIQRRADEISRKVYRTAEDDLKLIDYWTRIRQLEKLEGNPTEHSASKLYDAYLFPIKTLEDFPLIIRVAQRALDCPDLSEDQHRTIVRFTVQACSTDIRKRLAVSRKLCISYATLLSDFLRKNARFVVGSSMSARAQFYLDWAFALDLDGDRDGAIKRLKEINEALSHYSPGSIDRAWVCYELAILESSINLREAKEFAKREVEILSNTDTNVIQEARLAALIALCPELVERGLVEAKTLEPVTSKFNSADLLMSLTFPEGDSASIRLLDQYGQEDGANQESIRLFMNLGIWYRLQARLSESDRAFSQALKTVSAGKTSVAKKVAWNLQSQMIENYLLRNDVGKVLSDSESLLAAMTGEDDRCEARVLTMCADAALILKDNKAAELFATRAARLSDKLPAHSLDLSRLRYVQAELARRQNRLAEARELLTLVQSNIPVAAPWKDYWQMQKLTDALSASPHGGSR